MGRELSVALDALAGWPVDHAAAAIVGPDGIGDSTGHLDRRFALASVTKPLVALACLVAIEEETLDLDEPAGPEGATVRHLLAHTAGYGFDSGVVTEPGRRRIYSNTGFEVLGDHLAERADMPVADYLSGAVLEPLGMTATGLDDRSPAHGAHSTAGDMGRFATELVVPRLVAPATLAEATTVQFPGLAGTLPGVGRHVQEDWGLGFEIADDKDPHWTGSANSAATFGHFGASGTMVWVDPRAGLGLVALTDREFGPWALRAWPALSDAVLAAN